MAEQPGEGRIPVLHLITQLELGGAQENTLYTAAHLDRRRFLPYLYSGPGGILDDEARSLPGVEAGSIPHLVRELKPLADFRAMGEIRRVVEGIRRRRGGPVIVHTHSSKAGILGRWAARLAGADIIIHSIHGYGFTPRQPAPMRFLFILAERLTSLITDCFIAVSRDNIRTGKRLGLFTDRKVRLIRSGIVLESFIQPRKSSAEVRRELDIPEGSPVVGMIACFKPQKEPVDFVRMAGPVAERLPETRFLVVGDGVLRPEMEAAIQKEGLQGSVHLLGWRRDVPDLLQAMDVLVLTSRWEGLPRVCPQAMAAGVPVVANAVDGVPEAVADGETGYLVSPGDIPGMSLKVLRLLEDPDLAGRFGQEGSRRVLEFDADLMVRQQESLYQYLVEEHHRLRTA